MTNSFVRNTVAGLVLLAGAAPATAQTLVVDEGTFVLRIGSQEIGREAFSIRQNGSGAGAVVIAQGRVDLNEDAGVVTSLEVSGPALRPAAYQVQVQGEEPQRIAGRVTGGRFSARIVSPAGEMMREYLAGDGAVIIDDGVAHQHYFLARRLADAPFRIPVIIPRQSRQVSASVSAASGETIRVAGESVQARRFTVEMPSGTRTVWVDDDGRVLRLEIPSSGLVAERVELPR